MVHLRTLGESVVEIGEVRVGPAAPHMFAALLYLLLESGRRVTRSRLQELLFPDVDEQSAAHSLRQLLYRIRRTGVDVRADGTGVVVPSESVRADYESFLTPVDGERSDVGKVAGGVLPGFAPTFSRPFVEWLELRRADLETRIRRVLTIELANHRRAARWHMTEQTARAILSLDQFNEEATLALAEAIALSGSKLEAVQLLDTYIEEVGPRERALRVPAAILKRRIAERLGDVPYAPSSPFVGRDEPMRVLRSLLDAARAGHSSACHIWGDAGIGKTRLVTEFARAAVLDGVCVQQTSAQPHDVRRPMGAFIDLVPNLLRLPGALGCSPEAIGFLRKLYKYESDPSAVPSPDAREAELLSANITTAISELLDAITSESAFVLILEDVQWLDPISLKVVVDLAAERKDRQMLLVLTSREVALSGATHVERMTSLRLLQLSPSESSRVLAELLARHGVQAGRSLQEWFLAVAGGNPFFLYSLGLHYATTRDTRSIPAPLTALLTQRISVLSRTAQHVLAAVVILSRHSTVDNLERVLALPTHALVDALQSLCDLGYVDFTGQNLSATHALLGDMTLRRTARPVKVALHRRAAELLGNVARRQNSATALWEAAEHWLQAGDAQQSVTALQACAKHALEIGRPNDAVEALRRAAQLGESSDNLAVVRRDLLVAARIAGAWTTVLEVIGAMKADRSWSVESEPSLEGLELEALYRSAAPPGALADRLKRYANDPEIPAHERWEACMLMVCNAEDLLSEQLASEAFSTAQSLSEVGTESQVLGFEVVYHASFGDLDAAGEAAGKLLALARIQPNYAAACRMLLTASGGLLRAGVTEGLQALERCYAIASEHRLAGMQFRAATSLAGFFFDSGQIGESLAWHRKAMLAFEQLGGRDKVGAFFSNCVVLSLLVGDIDAARTWVRRALQDVPAASVGHAGLHFRALDLRVKQIGDGYVCSDEELDELLALHRRYRGLGYHDDVMEAVWHALERKGRAAEADALLREYLQSHRRLKSPIPPTLSQLANSRFGYVGCAAVWEGPAARTLDF